MMYDEEFIKQVHLRPYLWNPTLYNNRRMRDNAWIEMSELFPDKSPAECRVKWKKLKDARAASRRKIKNNLTFRPYKYALEMSFLDEFDDEQFELEQEQLQEQKEENTQEHIKQEHKVEQKVKVYAQGPPPATPVRCIQIHRAPANITAPLKPAATDETAESVILDRVPRDEHTHFAMSVAHLMRALPPNLASEMRIKIFQLLHKATYQYSDPLE